jgi:hypothetical protein
VSESAAEPKTTRTHRGHLDVAGLLVLLGLVLILWQPAKVQRSRTWMPVRDRGAMTSAGEMSALSVATETHPSDRTASRPPIAGSV